MALRLDINEKSTHIINYKDQKTGKVLVPFEVNILTPDQIDELVNKHTHYEWDSATRRTPKQRFERFDTIGFQKDKIDAVLVGWPGLLDPDGKQYECTRENKLKVYKNHTHIIVWLLEEIDKISDSMAELKQAKEKNSSKTPSGKQKKA